jgi:uncharacterized protein YjbI with pentapeptide repeats
MLPKIKMHSLKIALGAAIPAGVILFAYTNATKTKGPWFDEATRTCMTKGAFGLTLGAKIESDSLEDCSIGHSLKLFVNVPSRELRGVDLVNSSFAATNSKFASVASNFFDFQFADAMLDEAQIEYSNFYRPVFQNNSIARSRIAHSQFLGSSTDPVASSAELRVEHSVFHQVSLSGLHWQKAQFAQVQMSGLLENIKIDEFIARGSQFHNTTLSRVNFSGAQIMGSDFTKVKVCGDVNFTQSYWSRTPIELVSRVESTEGEPCTQPLHLNFSQANLRFADIAILGLSAQARVSFAGADLRGADLRKLNVSQGQWDFRSARIDKQTRLPAQFPFTKQVVFSQQAKSSKAKPAKKK